MPAPDASGSTYGHGNAWGTRLVRLLLVAAVLLSLAGVYSYGIFTTPWLLAPLWIAARRAGPRERFLWIALATPCALLVGWLLSYSIEHRVGALPMMFTLTVVVLFWVSTRPSLRSRDRGAVVGL